MHLTQDDKISPAGTPQNLTYDEFFASVPLVIIAECDQYQYALNEAPFYPPKAELGLGMAYRGNRSIKHEPCPRYR